MTRRTFLSSLLPPPEFRRPTAYSFAELMTLYKANLSPSAWKKVEAIRRLIDVRNVCRFLEGRPIDRRGNISEKALAEELTYRELFPPYFYEHFDRYKGVEEQIRLFPRLLSLFLQREKEKHRGFLRFYFELERKSRLISVALRARRLGLDSKEAFQYEDARDPLVAEILAQGERAQLALPSEFSHLAEVAKREESSPMELYQAMQHYRYRCVAQAIQDHPLSLAYLLGYSVQFMLVEDRNALEEKGGGEQLHRIAEGDGEL